MLRLASADDLEAIVAIYNASIPGRLATADLEPVSVAQRTPWLLERDLSRRPVWVAATAAGEVVGWASLGDFYGRPAYAATAESAVYVAPEAAGQGLGRRLLDHLLAEAPGCGVTTVLAFVFAHNEPSLRLFGSRGFERWGLLPAVADLDGTPADLAILGRRAG